MKRIRIMLMPLFMALVMAFSPAGIMQAVFMSTEAEAATKKVTKVTLNITSATLTKGKTVTLKATVSPSNATKKTVKWTSSNTKVATVSSKGVVKGVKAGTATITAKATDGSGKKATCKVTVKTASVPNVTDTVLKKKYAAAAKYLGLTQKALYYDGYVDYPSYHYVRKGRKPFDGSVNLEYGYGSEGGHWNLFIEDKTIAFQGIKVGMSESKVKSILNKKWGQPDRDTYYFDSDAIMLQYYRNMNFEWGDGGSLDVIIKNDKVIRIEYITDGD